MNRDKTEATSCRVQVCLISVLSTVILSCDHATKVVKTSPTADTLIEYELIGESDEINLALSKWAKLIIAESREVNPLYRSGDGSIVDCLDSQLTLEIKESITNESSVRWVRIVSDSNSHSDNSWMRNAKSLKGLSLRNFRNGGVQINVLSQMSNLRWLDLRGSKLSSTRRGEPLDLTRVEVACLGSTGCSDQQIKRLGFSRKLRILGLPACEITDEGVTHIANTYSELTVLDISWCPQVTTASMRELPKLRQLRTLWVLGMPLSKQYEDLKQSMPECEIRAID